MQLISPTYIPLKFSYSPLKSTSFRHSSHFFDFHQPSLLPYVYKTIPLKTIRSFIKSNTVFSIHMAPLQEICFLKKKLLVFLVILISFVLFTCSMYISTTSSQIQSQEHKFLSGRRLLEVDDEDQQPIKKKKKINENINSSKNQTKILKTTNGSPKNQTKVVKSITSSSKNQTKIPKTISSELANKNKTKLTKPTSDSAKENKNSIKSQFKKLNSTSKSLNSAKNSTTLLIKKSSDLSKTSSEKNKTTKKETKSISDNNIGSDSDLKNTKSKSPDKKQPSNQKPKSENIVSSKQTLPSWIDNDDDDDLVSGFNNLPSKFQETLLPDLERISKTSQIYLNKANKEITRNFKPYIGNKYAPIIASSVSLIIIIIPLLFVSLIFNKFKAYFSLQKILIFIHIYLSIYFSILCLSSLATGLEPLKFLYATSHSTYVCLMVMQTLGYVLYLLLLLMYLILVFSTDTATPTKFLGLAQIFMGFSVGLHYYMTVFHQAILHQPPKTSWKIHAIYTTCFLLICVLTRADRRKKAYIVDGADEGKYS